MQTVLAGGLIAVGAGENPPLLVAVLVAVDKDLAAVAQVDRAVLDVLPAPCNRKLLVLDLGQQAVAALDIGEPLKLVLPLLPPRSFLPRLAGLGVVLLGESYEM